MKRSLRKIGKEELSKEFSLNESRIRQNKGVEVDVEVGDKEGGKRRAWIGSDSEIIRLDSAGPARFPQNLSDRIDFPS